MEVEHIRRRLMLLSVGFFEILAKLLKLNRMSFPELRHLDDSFTLIDNEFLVPDSSEGLELTAVLMFNVVFFSLMLLDQ